MAEEPILVHLPAVAALVAARARQNQRAQICGRCSNSRYGGSGFGVAAPLFRERGRRSVLRRAGCRNGGQARPKAFERVVPERITRQGLQAKNFAIARGQNRIVLQDHVHEVRTFEMGCPYLLAGSAIERYDRAFNADKYEV